MWISALKTTENAVNMLPVPTYLTAIAPVIMDTLVIDLTAHVRYCLYMIAVVVVVLAVVLLLRATLKIPVMMMMTMICSIYKHGVDYNAF